MALRAFLAPIEAAPRWQKLLIGIMGLIVILAGSYYFLLTPAQTRVVGLRAKRASLEAELIQNRRMVADLARVKQELAELEMKMEAVKEKLPTEKEMPGVYRAVSDAALQAGLGVALFQTKDAKVSDYYSEVPIVVGAEGGYHDVGMFLGKVAGLPRVVNLTDWKLSGLTKSKESLKADLTLATYVYRPVGSGPAPKPPRPGAPATPAAAKPATPAPPRGKP